MKAIHLNIYPCDKTLCAKREKKKNNEKLKALESYPI
jgi:hypothetical protein